MTPFTRWNDLLLCEFFSPATANEQVWLHTSRAELDSFGLHLGGTTGLVDAVRNGPGWLPHTVTGWAAIVKRLVNQRSNALRGDHYVDPGQLRSSYAGCSAPTYLPILAVWVLASSEQENGFYDEVDRLLGSSGLQRNRVVVAMDSAWKDLQQWSIDTQGAFGHFRALVLGKQRFVGLARSQCLVSRTDVRGLNRLFKVLDLSPGQQLSDTTFNNLLQQGNASPALSGALRQAMATQVYREPLREIVTRYLREWDGRTDDSGQGIESEGDQTEVTLALSLATWGDGEWAIRWRFPSVGREVYCTMTIGQQRIAATLESTGDCFITAECEPSSDLCALTLVQSQSTAVSVNIVADDGEDGAASGSSHEGTIRVRSRRLLSWNTADPNAGEFLLERGWPVGGPAYLLYHSANGAIASAQHLLRGIHHEAVDAKGLPQGWHLVCIADVAQVSAERREQVLPGDLSDAAKARIRLVGGRPLLRGGARLYASYDLPMVELEAAAQVVLEAKGLKLNKVWESVSYDGAYSIRRFRIELPAEFNGGVCVLNALSGDQTLATKRLRLSSDDGEGLAIGRSFSVDRTGRGAYHDEGLRGAIGVGLAHGGDDWQGLPLEVAIPHVHGGGNDIEAFEGPVAKFLDSLAQLGSMAYGSARDQLVRLSDSIHSSIQPATVLLRLRARGHLELETDAKGHLIRVHAVKPTLYSLPVHHDGLPLFSVCGSLRLEHWRQLADRDFIRHAIVTGPGEPPAVSLAAQEEDCVKRFCVTFPHFAYRAMPAASIANWAAPLESVKAELAGRGLEGLASNLRELHRLMPNTAQFIRVAGNQMRVDQDIRCQLFRFDDPQVPGFALHVLGLVGPDNRTIFSHVHDSRWGVWLAVAAFAELLRHKFERTDACPWPIPVDNINRDLWLPSVLRPPYILERALVMCSGLPPEVVKLEGHPAGTGWELCHSGTGTRLGFTSRVYEDFMQGPWLRYRWVPGEVASLVASRLGGNLIDLSNDPQYEQVAI